jgi:hypothetical protein
LIALDRDRVAQHIDDQVRAYVPQHQVAMHEPVFELSRCPIVTAGGLRNEFLEHACGAWREDVPFWRSCPCAPWVSAGATIPAMLINRAELVYHTAHDPDRDILKLAVTPRAGSHMETLAFYFPGVDGKHAELVLHWGTVVVPLNIDVP